MEKIRIRFIIKGLVLFGFLLLSLTHFKATSANIYKRYSIFQCDSLVKANVDNPNFVILDVRTPGEYIPDHLKGAINRNSGDADINTKLSLLSRSKIYLLHCASGARSAGVFSKMQSLAFTQVYEMIGGINAWRSATRPTVSTFEPRLMLLSALEISKGAVLGKRDTFKISITNRANDTLVFNSITFKNQTEFSTDFNKNLKLAGAEDYSFTVIYTPSIVILDTLKVSIESNDGVLYIPIPVKKGSLQAITSKLLSEIQVYPNPAKEKIWIKTNNPVGIKHVKINDLTGKTVFESRFSDDKREIDVSALKRGIYILNISGKVNYSEKLIINP